MLYSLNCFVDPVSSGLIGILPDSTAGLLRFKCVLTLIVVLMMVSALKPVYVRRFCHTHLVRCGPRASGGFLGSFPFSGI